MDKVEVIKFVMGIILLIISSGIVGFCLAKLIETSKYK